MVVFDRACHLGYNYAAMPRTIGFLALFLLLAGCGPVWYVPADFTYGTITAPEYTIATYTRITDNFAPVHIYIEGDGNSFSANGTPTGDPTPRGTFMRDLAARDASPNVAYVARPCQFIMSDACRVSDWTTGRFSSRVIDAMSRAVRELAKNRPVVLIGYSGGAMVAMLIMERNPGLDVREFISIAGVLNHDDWTHYFDDTPLSDSLSAGELPHVAMRHYVAEHDVIVSRELSQRWTGGVGLIIVPDATHDDFGDFEISFN